MNDDYNNFKWPVRYDEHPDIWEAWEIVRKGHDGYYGSVVPPRPLGQLFVTREKNFYPLAYNSYFNEGYRYYWVDYDSGKWIELTRNEFREKRFYYEYMVNGCGRCVNILNFAYSAIKPPAYPKDYTYQDYNKYLRSYYPDYIADDVCAVFVLWNRDGRPLVQIRQKCGNRWDMVYPGNKTYVPLSKFYWHNLEDFGRNFGEVEQIHPREWFGHRVGKLNEKTYTRIGTHFYRSDIPPMPKPVGWTSMSLKQKIAYENNYQRMHDH